MAPTPLAGLIDIQSAAQQLGMRDNRPYEELAVKLVQNDPAAVRSAADQLANAVFGGLENGRQNMRFAGSDVRAVWQGNAATGFESDQTDLLNQVANVANAVSDNAALLAEIGTRWELGDNSVRTATAFTGAYLRMLNARAALGVQ